jgi:hypothetical protein
MEACRPDESVEEPRDALTVMTAGIHERPAAVAGVDGGVGLDDVVQDRAATAVTPAAMTVMRRLGPVVPRPPGDGETSSGGGEGTSFSVERLIVVLPDAWVVVGLHPRQRLVRKR